MTMSFMKKVRRAKLASERLTRLNNPSPQLQRIFMKMTLIYETFETFSVKVSSLCILQIKTLE